MNTSTFKAAKASKNISPATAEPTQAAEPSAPDIETPKGEQSPRFMLTGQNGDKAASIDATPAVLGHDVKGIDGLVVSGRGLDKLLGVEQQYTPWIQGHIDMCKLTAGAAYKSYHCNSKDHLALRKLFDHALTHGAATRIFGNHLAELQAKEIVSVNGKPYYIAATNKNGHHMGHVPINGLSVEQLAAALDPTI